MKYASHAATIAGAVVLALAASAVEAAPAIGITGAIKGETGHIEKATYGWHKHCYWRWGYRHCHRSHKYWGGYPYWGSYRKWGHYHGRYHRRWRGHRY
jgi:hypothetical protein